jgi:hypothetical protein
VNQENCVLKDEDEIRRNLNIMTTRFNPIFTVQATPASVSTRTAKNGTRYVVSQDSAIVLPNGNTETRTIMAFGKARDALGRSLRKGKQVSLRVQRDGGSLKVLGLARAA